MFPPAWAIPTGRTGALTPRALIETSTGTGGHRGRGRGGRRVGHGRRGPAHRRPEVRATRPDGGCVTLGAVSGLSCDRIDCNRGTPGVWHHRVRACSEKWQCHRALTSFDPAWRLLVATGFVGAYTTFSTFEYETNRLVETGSTAWAVTNVLASVLVGFLAVRLGVALAR